MLHRPAADPRARSAPAALVKPDSAADPEWTPPSWEELVRDHSARVYRLAYRLTGNRPDAEDLTQDVFVRVFRSLHRFQPGTFEGWLHRITTNLFLDGARRRQKIRFDGLADGSAERLPSALPSRLNSWPMPIWTTTLPRRWPPCRRSSAPQWCSATSRVSPTRRSARCSTSRSAPCEAGSTGAAPSCAQPSTTAGRPACGIATSVSRWRAPAAAPGADQGGRVWSQRGHREEGALRRACGTAVGVRGRCAQTTRTARSCSLTWLAVRSAGRTSLTSAQCGTCSAGPRPRTPQRCLTCRRGLSRSPAPRRPSRCGPDRSVAPRVAKAAYCQVSGECGGSG